ncbi:MAG TPA: ADP-ribosylglycohydrolase family protein, partial [Chthonomonadaceae bacterium]|nr:ADP-ribosylglycohydrolase family protein [Chthonomonadaceae bacterium]
MAALTLTLDTYRDKVFGGWQGKSAGLTLGAGQRGQLTPGRNNFYSPVPGQPVASVALDFPLVWLEVMEQVGPEVAPEDLAVAWLEHLDYQQDEFGYAALNLRRGLPPPASGAHANWFRHATGGLLRADFWAMLAPGAPQVAAAYAYHDAKLDHSEDGLWAAMFLAALDSAAFFLTDPLTLVTIGLAMIPRTCRTARAIKTALAAAQRAAPWLEARESIQHEVGHPNFTDVAQNLGFFTVGLFYGMGDFGGSLCAAVNCGYDAEIVGGALGGTLGILRGGSGLPANWTRPIGDIVIPGLGMRDFDAPQTITAVTERVIAVGRRVVAERCPDVEIVEPIEPMTPPAPPPPDSPMPSPADLPEDETPTVTGAALPPA